MTSIDFYLMEVADAQPERFAAKLALDAFRQYKQVHLHSSDESSLQSLSDMLWKFSESSFIAHGTDANNAITLGHGDQVPDSHDHMIVVSNKIPKCFSRFEQLSVVVAPSEAAKTVAREQYRYFKQRGYPLNFRSVKHSNF